MCTTADTSAPGTTVRPGSDVTTSCGTISSTDTITLRGVVPNPVFPGMQAGQPGSRELTDGEAQAIVAQIEKSAGRKVEATRSVDPDLVGGIVLQVGSHLADASVRGRLERLRQELVRS